MMKNTEPEISKKILKYIADSINKRANFAVIEKQGELRFVSPYAPADYYSIIRKTVGGERNLLLCKHFFYREINELDVIHILRFKRDSFDFDEQLKKVEKRIAEIDKQRQQKELF